MRAWVRGIHLGTPNFTPVTIRHIKNRHGSVRALTNECTINMQITSKDLTQGTGIDEGMLSNDDDNWAAIAPRRTPAESVPRRVVMAKLDRRAALTIVRAPSGYGKSSLIASWLRTHLISQQILVWVPAPTASSTIDEYWRTVLTRIHAAGIALPDPGGPPADPFSAITAVLTASHRPVLIVLIRPDLIPHPGVGDLIVELLTHCHTLHVIVTVSGTSMFPEPYLLDIDHEVIRTRELLFTAADTAHLLPLTGALSLPNDPARITALTGGIPALVRAAVAAVTNLPGVGDRARLLDQCVDRAVDAYTADHVLPTADALGQRDFVLRTAYARALTTGLAQPLYNSDINEPAPRIRERLVVLESAGTLTRIEGEPEETWELPPPVRRSILRLHTRAGRNVRQQLSSLAHHQLANRRAAAALDYAIEAQNWALTAGIIDRHWAAMLAGDAHTLQTALANIPHEAASQYPGVLAGRVMLGTNPAVDIEMYPPLPQSPRELSALATTDVAKDALDIGCVRSIILRNAGEYDKSVALTRRLSHLARSAHEHDPDAVTAQLPLMRAHWARNHQLRGTLTESTAEARAAYHGALTQNVEFLARTAAGTIALNWAIVGESVHARHWSELERKHANRDCRHEPLLRTAGLVARTLIALDSLTDAEAEAHTALTDTADLTDTDAEELWAFVIYAHSRYALTRADTTAVFGALSLLRRTLSTHTHHNTATSMSLPLMHATEIDLLLALGEANAATAAAADIIDPATTPWTLVSVARLHQRIGRNEAALALCHQYDCSAESNPRLQMEVQLVEAVAHIALRHPQLAAQAWSRACSIADQTGLLSVFSTISTTDIDTVEETAKTASRALSQFRATPLAEWFPKNVHIVTLTEREHTVLALLAHGMAPAAIADTLFVSVNTVKTQLRTLYRKLGAHNRKDAISRAHALKLLRPHAPEPPAASAPPKEQRT